MTNFEFWWQNVASEERQGMFEDKTEFAKRLCEMAWSAAAADAIKSVNTGEIKRHKDICGND